MHLFFCYQELFVVCFSNFIKFTLMVSYMVSYICSPASNDNALVA